MLVIRPVHTSYEREEYTKMFGITPQDGFHVIAALNDMEFVGASYVSFDGKDGYIHNMSLVDGYDDLTDKILLGKATLNFLDMSGAKDIVFVTDDEKFAKMLGFKLSDGKYFLNLTGYFDGNCQGHCEEAK